jgi:putative colanic acid biosynthesis acetyltransferase WcaF
MTSQPRHVYRNPLSFGNKSRRVLWAVVYRLFFRPTFARCEVHRAWRVLLLRAFGTRCWKGIQVYPDCRIWAPWNLRTGRSVAIDTAVDLYNVDRIAIGNFVAISRRAFLCTATHDIADVSRRLVTRPITIGDGVWIGAQAYIGPGVTVGEGAVVGACAVVTKDVPPWTVVAGNPARVIRERPVDRNEWREVFRQLGAKGAGTDAGTV